MYCPLHGVQMEPPASEADYEGDDVVYECLVCAKDVEDFWQELQLAPGLRGIVNGVPKCEECGAVHHRLGCSYYDHNVPEPEEACTVYSLGDAKSREGVKP